MPVKSYEEQLEQVQAAIEQILTRGQAVDVNGRALTRANLRALQEREKWLIQQVERQKRGGIRVRRAVPD